MITVITVVLNDKKNISDTIESVISFNRNKINFIIIDGGSTDGTVDVIKKYNDKIDYWISEKDYGIYDAMNKGWKLANVNSDVLFLGSGDKIVSLPDEAELKRYSNCVKYGSVYLDNRIFRSYKNWKLKAGNTLHHQALLIPKNIHTSEPFDTKYKIYADFDFNQRLYKKGISFIKLDNLVAYAKPNGISEKMDVCELIKITKKNFGLFWTIFVVFNYITYTIKKFYLFFLDD